MSVFMAPPCGCRDLSVRRDQCFGVVVRLAMGMGFLCPSGTIKAMASDHCRPLAISAGRLSSFMVAQDGAAWSWGDDASGQLGRGVGGPLPFVTRPQDRIAVPLLQAMVAGDQHALALGFDGRVWTWGGNSFGQLGDGTTQSASSPVDLRVGFQPVAIGIGRFHSMAIDSAGDLWAWGANFKGQLGDGSTTNSSVPLRVQGIAGVSEAVGGSNHTLALFGNGDVWTWGYNNSGQLGDGTRTDRLLPQRVPGLDAVVRVAAGADYSVALRSDGTVWVWGSGQVGQLGDGRWAVIETTPQQVPSLDSIVEIASGMEHIVAIRSDGAAFLWGGNVEGKLGMPYSQLEATPQLLAGVNDVVGAAGGEEHTLLKTASGLLLAMGSNSAGELGDGNFATGRWQPQAIDFDFVPDDLGNVLRASRIGDDVLVSFDGMDSGRRAVYADPAKESLGTTAVSPLPMQPGWVHTGAVSTPPALLFYRGRALSACTLSPGP